MIPQPSPTGNTVAAGSPNDAKAAASKVAVNPLVESLGAAATPEIQKNIKTSATSINQGTGSQRKVEAPEIKPVIPWSPPKELVNDVVFPPAGTVTLATATYIQDGDTARLDNKGGGKLLCRLDMTDAPETAKPSKGEKGQPYAEESKRTLADLVMGKEARVQIVKSKDIHDRSICKLSVEGKDIDQAMLEKGATWLYKYAKNVAPEMFEAEATAKREGRGLFADKKAINPWDFKHPNGR